MFGCFVNAWWDRISVQFDFRFENPKSGITIIGNKPLVDIYLGLHVKLQFTIIDRYWRIANIHCNTIWDDVVIWRVYNVTSEPLSMRVKFLAQGNKDERHRQRWGSNILNHILTNCCCVRDYNILMLYFVSFQMNYSSCIHIANS